MTETLTIKQAEQALEGMTAEARSEMSLQLLNNPVFVATLGALERSESEALLNTSPDNADMREVHYFKVQCIRSLRGDLQSTWRNITRPSSNAAKKSAEKTLKRG